jgi:hypothetical protein
MEDALRAISTSWLSKLKQAQKHKKPFSDDAKECMNFFDGHGDWFWKTDGKSDKSYSKLAPPSFRMCLNKAFEAVKLFGSVIYHRNPVRTVTPRTFPAVPPQALGIDPSQPPQMDPMTGQPASLIAQDVWEIIQKNAELLDSTLIYDRDYHFDYFGFKTLERSYLLKINGKVAERPQHMLMRVSVGIHGDDLEAAIETYNLMSEKFFSNSSLSSL